MNNKKFCKVAILCICIIVISVVCSTTSYAKEVDTQVGTWTVYISTCSTDIGISSSGMATVTGQVRGKTGVTSAYVKVTLQKYVSGDWVDVNCWEDSQNGRNAFVSETYQVSRGTYRVVATCTANSETKTLTSTEKTY